MSKATLIIFIAMLSCIIIPSVFADDFNDLKCSEIFLESKDYKAYMQCRNKVMELDCYKYFWPDGELEKYSKCLDLKEDAEKYIFWSSGSADISLGKSKQIVLDENEDEEINWESSNPEIIEVSEDGIVTARGFGIAAVTGTNSEGKKVFSCKISAGFKDFFGFEYLPGIEEDIDFSKYNKRLKK